MKNFLLSCICGLLLCVYSCKHDADSSWPNDEASLADGPGILSINELLFNPPADGMDFVELVNVSADNLQLSAFSLANRNSKGEVAAVKPLPSMLLPPAAYVLLCCDTSWMSAYYHLPDTARVLSMKSLPAYANASGSVVLLSSDGSIVDEFPYQDDFHHPLVSDKKALSLEKLHPLLPSANSFSWTTAALDVGGATPAARNSQYRARFAQLTQRKHDCFEVLQRGIQPNKLSSCSQWIFAYHFEETYIMTLLLYDVDGLPCATIADNLLLGSSGNLSWPGIDDEGRVLPPGDYILKADAYTISGKTWHKTFALRVEE